MNIDTRQLAEMLDRGVPVVDVRTPEEWRQTGIIDGSVLITAFDSQGRFDPSFPEKFAAVAESGDEVAIICRTGNRSSVISRALTQQAGYTQVYNVDGGIVDWLAGGRATTPCTSC